MAAIIDRDTNIRGVWISDETGAQVGTSTTPLVVSSGSGGSANQVQGNVASAAVDTGNPVKIGLRYNSAGVTVTNGQRVDAQGDANGNLIIRMFAARPGGGDGVANASITSVTGADSPSTDASLRPLATAPYAYNGATFDRMRGTTDGLWTVPGLLPAGTDRSTSATTSSTQLAAANASRRGLNIQNIGANNVGINEFGGTAAIGTAGTYTLTPGSSMNVRTNRQINMIAATATTALSATEF